MGLEIRQPFVGHQMRQPWESRRPAARISMLGMTVGIVMECVIRL